jgi:hypothetical protein
MSYRLAKSLGILRDEVNAAAPNRSKVSDGWIGDAAHASRTSDHNPWVKDHQGVGVVRAYDFTHDPRNGCDAALLAQHLRALAVKGDRRISYLIFNRKIASPINNWAWRAYSGPNAHTSHIHISVSQTRTHYDSTKGWGWPPKPVSPPKPSEPDVTPQDHQKIAQSVVDAIKPLAARLTKVEQATAATQKLVSRNLPASGMSVEQEIDALRRAMRTVLAEQGVPKDKIKETGV